MVKRSIEQNLRIKNFEARNAVVKNQGTKQHERRTLGDCWQWKANGQCVKGDNCSFRHDINKRAKTTQPNPSPRSSTRQNEKKCIENPKSQRCEQNTLTRYIFACLHACLTVRHVTLAQGVVRVIPSMCQALVCLSFLRLSTLHSSLSLSSSTSSS